MSRDLLAELDRWPDEETAETAMDFIEGSHWVAFVEEARTWHRTRSAPDFSGTIRDRVRQRGIHVPTQITPLLNRFVDRRSGACRALGLSTELPAQGDSRSSVSGVPALARGLTLCSFRALGLCMTWLTLSRLFEVGSTELTLSTH